MKKLLCLIIPVCLIVCLGACGQKVKIGEYEFDFTLPQITENRVTDRGSVPPETEETRETTEYSEPVQVMTEYSEPAGQTTEGLFNNIKGCYVTTEQLCRDITGVIGAVRSLEPGTRVLIDVKDIHGNFFYGSHITDARNPDIDPEAMEQLMGILNEKGCYTIARFPALRDRKYALEHVQDGLLGGAHYLWMDEKGCYWLNPESEGTAAYLESILRELQGLGFQEAVLTDFCFPDTQNILFDGDREEAIRNAAKDLVVSFNRSGMTVSFSGPWDFPLPDNSRLYLENVREPGLVFTQDSLSPYQIVFLKETADDRFDTCNLLTPLPV